MKAKQSRRKNEKLKITFGGRAFGGGDQRSIRDAIPRENLRIEQQRIQTNTFAYKKGPSDGANSEATRSQLQRHLQSRESRAIFVPKQDSVSISSNMLESKKLTELWKLARISDDKM